MPNLVCDNPTDDPQDSTRDQRVKELLARIKANVAARQAAAADSAGGEEKTDMVERPCYLTIPLVAEDAITAGPSRLRQKHGIFGLGKRLYSRPEPAMAKRQDGSGKRDTAGPSRLKIR